MSPVPAGSPGRLAVFTICSNNYMPFARVLRHSVGRFHPDADFFLCLADRRCGLDGFYPPDATVVEADGLGIPEFADFSFRYAILEFNTAVKPFMMLHLLQQRGYDRVIYFDPDIELFAPVSVVTERLDAGASFVFTPHLCSPSDGPTEPNDITIMRAGVFNLGFLAAGSGGETIGVLQWWARRLRLQCVDAQAEGLFVDQKFMNLVPGFAPRTAICRDPALNVAYWNLGQRVLADDGAGGWSVDGRPLGFFHFSGFDPANPGRLSKHAPGFDDRLSPALARLTAAYAARLVAHGHGSDPAMPYAYASYRSGAPITAADRQRYRDAEPRHADPFATFEPAED